MRDLRLINIALLFRNATLFRLGNAADKSNFSARMRPTTWTNINARKILIHTPLPLCFRALANTQTDAALAGRMACCPAG